MVDVAQSTAVPPATTEIPLTNGTHSGTPMDSNDKSNKDVSAGDVPQVVFLIHFNLVLLQLQGRI